MKTKLANYKRLIWHRSIKRAWETFGAYITAFGVVVSFILYFWLGNIEALISAIAFSGFFILLILLYAFKEPMVVYEEQRQVIKSLKEQVEVLENETLGEDSFDITHFSSPSAYYIEVGYVRGNEPVKILSVEANCINSDNLPEQIQITQFYSGGISSNNHINLNVVRDGYSFCFPPPDTHPDKREVNVTLHLYGLKSKKDIKITRTITLKSNEQWLVT